MDLFELQAKLRLDDSSFNKGIVAANAAGEALKGHMSAATVAVGNLAADMVRKGVNAISSTIKGAMDGFANYQQLVGGVETLFKGSAKRVADYAKQSYKTTGLSANDYMDTVTSFSASLLQGLKGDTEAAADLANTAVTDMADNANKMGTDISMIQNAYQGFAKGNYTMLDNLKLGYGGTKGEMVRLINDSGILEKEIKDLDGITFPQLIQAIHAIQTEMGITGTTAKEAEGTIQGSAASMKAAWTDMLTAIAGDDGSGEGLNLDDSLKNFESAFNTYVNGNLIPTVSTTLRNSPKLITTVAEAITSIPPKAMAQAGTSMTGIIEGAADGAKKITDWVIDSLTATINDVNTNPEKVAEMGTAVGEFIGSTVADVVTSAPTLVPKLFQAGVNFAGSLVSGLFAGLTGADEGVYGAFSDADKELSDSIREANKSATEAKGVLDFMDSLVGKYGESAKNTREWNQALERLEQVMPGATEKIEAQNGTLSDSIQNLRTEVELIKLRATTQAREKALQGKRDAYYEAVGDLAAARTDLEIAQSTRTKAQDQLVRYIKKYNPNADIESILEGGNVGTSAAYALMNSGLDKNSDEYKAAKDAIDGFSDVLNSSDTQILELESSIAGLEEQVSYAETSLLMTESALTEMTSAAEHAAEVLGGLSAPGGSGYDPFTDGIDMNPHHHATGMGYVPYNGYHAELHRGEAVLTAAENQAYRNGMGTDEVVGAIQEMRQDLQNLRLVVGEKTFGRAVVNYGGRRMDGYIGESENRLASGYGASGR